MSTTIRNSLHLVPIVCCVVGCGGDGLTRGFPDQGTPGITPTLGDYGWPCGVLGNSQPMLPAFSATGNALALADAPGHVEILATGNGQAVTSLAAHVGRVTAMAFSPTQDLLATAGADGVVKLWSGELLLGQSLAFNRPVTRLVWSHDGLNLAAASEFGPLAVLAVEESTLTLRWQDGRPYEGTPLFAPGDALLIAYGWGDNHVLRVLNGSETSPVTVPLSASSWTNLPHRVLAQSPDGSLIAFDATDRGHLTVARLAANGESLVASSLWERGAPSDLGGIVFTGDSKRLVVWGINSSSLGERAKSTEPASVYDVDNGNLVDTLAWANASANQIAFSRDGRFGLALDSEDHGGAARLVDLGSGSSLSVATQPSAAESLGNTSVSISADGVMMASRIVGSSAGVTAVALWNLATLEGVGQIAWPNGEPYGPVARGWPALSARGDLLYGRQFDSMPGSNGSVRLESLVDASHSTTLPDARPTFAFALSPDGRTLAGAWEASETASSADWNIWLYDLVAGTYTGEFSIGNRPTDIMRFSPDGTALAIARQSTWSSDGAEPAHGMSVWRIPAGQLLWEPSAHSFPTQDIAFSPDGAFLVLVGWGGGGASDGPGIVVYDARRGTQLRALDEAAGFRPSVRFSPDGLHLMVLSLWDGIEIWRTSDWQRYNALGAVWGSDAVFLPDNRSLLETSTGLVWCAN